MHPMGGCVCYGIYKIRLPKPEMHRKKNSSPTEIGGVFALSPHPCVVKTCFFNTTAALAAISLAPQAQISLSSDNFTRRRRISLRFSETPHPVCREIPFSLQKLSVSPAFAPLRQKKCFPAACFDKNPVFTLVQWCQEAYMAKTETRSRKWMFKIMNGRRDF